MEDEDDDEDNKDENEQRVYQTSKATTTTTTSTATTYRARDVSCLDIIGQQQKITRSGRCDQPDGRAMPELYATCQSSDRRAGLSGGRHISNQDASMLRYLSEVVEGVEMPTRLLCACR